MTFLLVRTDKCLRNHYTKYREWIDGPHKGTMRKDGKKFQASQDDCLDIDRAKGECLTMLP